MSRKLVRFSVWFRENLFDPKEVWSDWKSVGRESGFLAFLAVGLIVILFSVLFLISLPFLAFHYWSKTWFGANPDES